MPRRLDAVGSQEVFESYMRYTSSFSSLYLLFATVLAQLLAACNRARKTHDDSHLLGHLLSVAERLDESTKRDRPSLKSWTLAPIMLRCLPVFLLYSACFDRCGKVGMCKCAI
jgi:hypothetical protein